MKEKNKIKSLKKPDGQVTEDAIEMGRLATTFYKELYRSEWVKDMDQVLNTVRAKVTTAMNEELIAHFEDREVKEALFQMFHTKAPGPNGFPTHFFQRHWDLCGEEVTSVVLHILKGEDNPGIINGTLIVLIPKVASA
jgi:hypothetical protein